MSKHEREGSEIPRFLMELEKRWPKFASRYLRNEAMEDVLFKSKCAYIESAPMPRDSSSSDGTADDDWENGEIGIEQGCPYCD